MIRGVVVVYCAHLGGRLGRHQTAVLEADARAIAALKGYDFAGVFDRTLDRSRPVFFVPDDTLLADEAARLGIRSAGELYGGVVPHPFVKTKAITHELIDETAARPRGWSPAFCARVRDLALPGYTVFCADDAHDAAKRMLGRGRVRVKQPLGASGQGQTLIGREAELDTVLDELPADDLATYGLVLEENLRDVVTLSVGQVAIDDRKVSYHGTQRITKDNDGRTIYGGSDLVCVRGGWEALAALELPPRLRAAVAAAIAYDAAMQEFPGFFASRRNYDVAQGLDADGRLRTGVLESSWRVGGASSAELVALIALARDPSLQTIATSHVEEFGVGCRAPPDALVHFQGDDPELGPLLRYTMVKPMRAARTSA